LLPAAFVLAAILLLAAGVRLPILKKKTRGRGKIRISVAYQPVFEAGSTNSLPKTSQSLTG